MCYPALEGMGIKRVRTEVSVSYLDHNPLYVIPTPRMTTSS